MLRRSYSAFLGLAVFLTVMAILPSSAQDDWRAVQPAHRPPARVSSDSVFDSQRNVVVLFGGMTDWDRSIHANDTWEFDGLDWHRVFTTHAPTPRRSHAMAYDSIRHVVVLFGGYSPDCGCQYSDTWEYDGNDWVQRFPTATPPANWQQGMTFDAARGVVVMFGGSGPIRDGHWEYDGSTWRERIFSVRPSPRATPSMAFDSADGSILLFGGYDGGVLGDTWRFDGTQWVKLNPPHSPGPRRALATVYRPEKDDFILFGGSDSANPPSAYYDETWRFHSGDWSRLTTAHSPPARYHLTMAYDATRQAVVVATGRNFSGSLDDTWELVADGAPRCGDGVVDPGEECDDGNNVNGDGCQADCRICTPSAEICNGQDDNCDGLVPADETDADADGFLACADCNDSSAAVYPGATEVCDGVDDNCDGSLPVEEQDADNDGYSTCYGDCDDQNAAANPAGVEVIDGADNDCDGTVDETTPGLSNWRVRDTANRPPARVSSDAAYDSVRGVMVLFGGMTDWNNQIHANDTWEYDGQDWTQKATQASPGPRRSHAMAYDEQRGVVVMFGGYDTDCDCIQNDTWEYNGTNWTLRHPAVSPPPTWQQAMAYDPVRHVVVLFGSNDPISDRHWEYNGTTWTERRATHRPAPRAQAAMAYDRVNSRMVLFGGYDGGVFNDTWTFDGTDWTRIQSTHSPPPRRAMGMAYRTQHADLILFGGSDRNNLPTFYFGDTWVFQGGDWSEVSTTITPPPRYHFPMIYDSSRDLVVLATGRNFGGSRDDTWEFGPFDAELDSDSDGVPDSRDNCLFTSNANQSNLDGDAFGNACDNCPFFVNNGQEDSDGDGIGDACDNCRLLINRTQRDIDLDGVGDSCDICIDWSDLNQMDADADGQGDFCDGDDGIVLFGRLSNDTIRWQSDPAFSAFNLYRGSLASLFATGDYTPAVGTSAAAARVCLVTTNELTDRARPIAGDSFYYLVTGYGHGKEGRLGDGDTVNRLGSRMCTPIAPPPEP